MMQEGLVSCSIYCSSGYVESCDLAFYDFLLYLTKVILLITTNLLIIL